jgi:hypothetical protein
MVWTPTGSKKFSNILDKIELPAVWIRLRISEATAGEGNPDKM